MAGYFMVADLLGFQQIVRNCAQEALNIRVAEWTSLVESAAKEVGISELQLISDTVFAAADSSSAGLWRLVSFAQALLTRGVPKSLLVRGAIVHGEYTWGEKLIYGTAVIEAHDLEKSQNWIGVSCGPHLPHLADHWGHDKLLAYVPPMRGDVIMIRPVVAWRTPAAQELSGHMSRGGLTKEGEQMRGHIGEKLNNTIQLATYRRVAAANGCRPDQFYGFNPMEFIELFVANAIARQGGNQPSTSSV